MFDRFFRKEECQACRVYKEVLNDTQNMLAAERAERQLLEERLLRHLRVIPVDGVAQPPVGPERIQRRADWDTIRAEEEKKLADAAPEVKARRLYWEKKVKKSEEDLGQPVVVNEDAKQA